MNLDKQQRGAPEPPPAPRRQRGIPRWVELLVLAATAVGGFFGGQVVVVNKDSGGEAKPSAEATVTATVTATSTVTASPSETTLAGGSVNASPATLLGRSYPKAVRLNCDEAGKSAVYNVSGYKTLQASVGIASDSYNAIGSVGSVSLTSASGNPIGRPVETRSSSVTKLSVDISGQDQVKITCVMTKTGSEGMSYFTTALGDAVLIAGPCPVARSARPGARSVFREFQPARSPVDFRQSFPLHAVLRRA
ncbi:hypothetical protein [Streptomyces mirabilis]|uniref:hypothetical protein n=1 Tax=Streptomyces mirabilis TaxID=68239 RepID=UPI00368419D2